MGSRLIGLVLIAAAAPATPVLACRDVIGQPPARMASLEQQDSVFVNDGAAAAIGTIISLDTTAGHMQVETVVRGSFEATVMLPNEVIVSCRSAPFPILPDGAVPGDRVLIVRSDERNIQYSVLLESQRGQRLLNLFPHPDFTAQ